jgi:hypothetical protein
VAVLRPRARSDRAAPGGLAVALTGAA